MMEGAEQRIGFGWLDSQQREPRHMIGFGWHSLEQRGNGMACYVQVNKTRETIRKHLLKSSKKRKITKIFWLGGYRS